MQNFSSRFDPTRSRKCIYFENGPKFERANFVLRFFLVGANILEPVTNCTFATANVEPCGFEFPNIPVAFPAMFNSLRSAPTVWQLSETLLRENKRLSCCNF